MDISKFHKLLVRFNKVKDFKHTFTLRDGGECYLLNSSLFKSWDFGSIGECVEYMEKEILKNKNL